MLDEGMMALDSQFGANNTGLEVRDGSANRDGDTSPKREPAGTRRCGDQSRALMQSLDTVDLVSSSGTEAVNSPSSEATLIRPTSISRREHIPRRASVQPNTAKVVDMIDLVSCSESEDDLTEPVMSLRGDKQEHAQASLDHALRRLGSLSVTRTDRETFCGLASQVSSIRMRWRTERLAPPTGEKLNDVLKWAFRGPQKYPLVTVKAAKITLQREDMCRLRGSSWLNDELVNSYVALLNARNAARREENASCGHNSRPCVQRVYCFTSFFYARLNATKAGYDYDGVRRWTTRAKVDVLSTDILLIPVNLGNTHWVLVSINMRRQSIHYLDSMSSPDSLSSFVMASLARWLDDEVNNKHPGATESGLNRAAGPWSCSSWPRKVLRHLPRQRDGGSCGVFMLMFAESIEWQGHDREFDFNHSHIPALRQRVCLELLGERLCTYEPCVS
ncbi:Ubiquitin-like-specific protease ESD4 [Porphyridium purpureum]|uniref:Ubiquitin-like-specific protease ESD4 n=1 Tax=Porphyridium purpureum TaxID=35688 RepID=A0A5J4Z2D2_PORPP|nr:Ubiquitin-like-specific protease ESD4 [Porphyridium purpureum]|eukprot:POR4440..scf208_2